MLVCSDLQPFASVVTPWNLSYTQCFTSNLVNPAITFSGQNFPPGSLTQLLPAQRPQFPESQILPHSTSASTLLRFLWLGTPNPRNSLSSPLSAFSWLHFLWSPAAFYFKLLYHSLARNHISSALLISCHSPGKIPALSGFPYPDCWVYPDRKSNIAVQVGISYCTFRATNFSWPLSILLGRKGHPYNVLVSTIWTSYSICQGREL